MSTVTIDQVKTEDFRLGLEKEGMQVYPDATQSFPIPRVKGKWNHGLTKEEQKIVETFYGYSFENPAHNEFWGDITFTIKNHLSSLDMSSGDNILKVSIMKQLGMCASSMDEVEENPNNKYVFVVKDRNEDNNKKLSLYLRQDKAKAELLKIMNTSGKYLRALAFVGTPNPYELGDSNELAYTRLRELITGEFTNKKSEGIDKFNTILEIDKPRLYCMVDVKKAIRKNIIRRNAKMEYYNPVSGVVYGKGEERVVTYLLDPTNQDEYGTSKDAPQFSIKKQLERIKT